MGRRTLLSDGLVEPPTVGGVAMEMAMERGRIIFLAQAKRRRPGSLRVRAWSFLEERAERTSERSRGKQLRIADGRQAGPLDAHEDSCMAW